MSATPSTIKSTHTPLRNFRASDELWHAAKEKAAATGETLTDVLTRALEEYVTPPAKPARRRQSGR